MTGVVRWLRLAAVVVGTGSGWACTDSAGVARVPTVVITSAPVLPQATVGVPYEAVFAATGGAGGEYAWEVNSGRVPAGLALSRSGVLTGTPGTSEQARFVVRVTRGPQRVDAEFTLVVDFPPLTITTSTLPVATLGRGYSHLLNATGGDPTHGVQWSLASGTLPAGITLNAAGTLTGNATTLGPFDFRLRAARGTRTAEQPLQLRVDPPPLLITTDVLPAARVGVPYVVQLEATGGVGPRAWSLAAGRLPPGFTLAADGALTGAGTSEDSTTFTVEVSSGTQRASRSLSMIVDPATFPATAVVDMPGDVFTPFLVRLRVGGVVTWRFPARAHNVIFAAAVGAPADINIVNNVEVSRTFTRPGDFRYDCTIHPGMAGRVEVR